jgi:RimJ/RimL family protein N-acetyltransferase
MASKAFMSSFYEHKTTLDPSNNPGFWMKSKQRPDLELRTPTFNDGEAMLRMFTDERNVKDDLSAAGLNSRAAIDKLITDWSTYSQPLSQANGVITINSSPVGICGFGWIGTNEAGTMIGDAGVMLDSDIRGKGYAYNALCITIDHGFRVLGLQEAHISTTDANDAMKGLMNDKMGFTAERIQKGRFGNDWLWTISKLEWEASVHSR